MKLPLYVLAVAATFAGTACKKSSEATPCGTTVVWADVQSSGIVWFDDQERVYSIRTSVPGTYDSQIVGFLCGELPAELRQDGLPVRFTGTYTTFEKYKSLIGGQELYYLSLSEVSKQ